MKLCTEQELNPQPVDRTSNTLPIAPPRHLRQHKVSLNTLRGWSRQSHDRRAMTLLHKVTIIWAPQSGTSAEGMNCRVRATHMQAIGAPTWESGGAL